MTLKAEPESNEPITPTDMETARTIIERRVAGIGVTEPQVRTETAGDGSQLIVVEVPGVDNPDQVRRLVGSTGQLEFIDPQGQQLTDGQDITALLEAGSVGVLFDGGEIDVASVTPAVDGNIIGVQFTLSDEASETWCNFTTANTGRPGPIALDGEVITVPNIQNAICGGQTIITVGPQTPENEVERTELYNTLRFGALPISLTEQGVQTVDPTLGADFLVQALIAGAVGLTLVLIFMIAYYRLPGVLAAIALDLLHARRVRGLPHDPRHADPGRRGRLHPLDRHGGRREHPHLRAHEGGDPRRQDARPAIEAGFNRAWSSILDSNVASLLVAGWLYWQGTTVVRGFALVLIVGVLVSMFSAVTVTRTMLRRVIRTGWGRNIELYHVER